MFKIIGELKVVNNEVRVTDSFKKREFVLEEKSSQYTQYINFQLTQDRCSIIDAFEIGQRIEVTFDLRGRKWVNKEGDAKYFNSLDVLKIEGYNQLPNIIPVASETLLPAADGEELPF